MKDIGYFIYHNCKKKDCEFFPIYHKEIGRYVTVVSGDGGRYLDYDCKFCQGCETYQKGEKINEQT